MLYGVSTTAAEDYISLTRNGNLVGRLQFQQIKNVPNSEVERWHQHSEKSICGSSAKKGKWAVALATLVQICSHIRCSVYTSPVACSNNITIIYNTTTIKYYYHIGNNQRAEM